MVVVKADQLVCEWVDVSVDSKAVSKAALMVAWSVDSLVGMMADWLGTMRAGQMALLRVEKWVGMLDMLMVDQKVDVWAEKLVSLLVAGKVG
jgi:hypothetical protein